MCCWKGTAVCVRPDLWMNEGGFLYEESKRDLADTLHHDG